MRSPNVMNDAPGDTSKMVNAVEYRKGDKVKLKLGKRPSDALDMMMDNKMATIEIIYTDYEDNTHIAVTIDDDPGQEMKRELGMYLYFKTDEVELVR
ncbi:MAG TPA: hypothetical protein VKR53_17460 [Puia sp.]|nr:hypothetical protein [Puia sp.]